MNDTMTVSRAVVEALSAEGVEQVFGMPGSHILGVYDALADSKIRYVGAVNECTSAFMAGMYGYLTGRPGVALLTAGPAATNSMTGVVQAAASSLPMVHITADVPLRGKHESFHGVDRPDFLHRMFRDVTKGSVRLEDPARVYEVLAWAFALARSGRPGPVHVDIPVDVASRPIPAGLRYRPHAVVRTPPSAALVDALATKLRAARRPVLCVGRGVLVHHAGAELQRLAERLQAPVLSTAYGLGAFDQTHPLALGTFSEFSSNAHAFELVAGSDFTCAVGLRANTVMAERLAKVVPQGSVFVALDEPPGEGSGEPETEPWTGWPGPVEAANIRSTLVAVLERLHDHQAEPEPTRLASIREQQGAFERGLAATLDRARGQTPLHFGVAVRALVDRLDRDAIVVSGVGNHHVWARNVVPVRDRSSFIAEAAWGTMGGELGGGIAAKLVHPKRQVVTITGDASLLMFGCDFATAVHERANLLVVVLNDGGHGIIGEMQRQMFGRAHADRLPAVDFARLAESLGGVGIRVDAPSRLSEALDQALQATARRPVVLDVVSDPRVPWPRRDELVALGRTLAEGGEGGDA